MRETPPTSSQDGKGIRAPGLQSLLGSWHLLARKAFHKDPSRVNSKPKTLNTQETGQQIKIQGIIDTEFKVTMPEMYKETQKMES